MNQTLHHLLACRRFLLCGKGAHRPLSNAASSRPNRSSHYDLLGVHEGASSEEIKQAFFSQCKKLHPDSDPTNPHLHTRFVKLNEAYGVLSREHSRREYDLSLRVHREWFSDAMRSDPFGHTYPMPGKPSAGPSQTDDERYWQQFHHPRSTERSAEWQHQRNKLLVGYCILIMLGSMLAHYIGFRTIKEVHNTVLEEQNYLLSKIYHESKEKARTNGLKKQQETLAQKHAEFIEKYRMKPASEGVQK